MSATVPVSPIARENRYDDLIARAAARFQVPGEIVKAVIAAESSFEPTAFRAEPQIQDASRGLMQLLERTARGLGFDGPVSDLFDPEVSITLGTALLSDLHRRFGNWRDALASYNGGLRILGPDGELRPELASYVAKVEGHAARWGIALPIVAGGAGAAIILLAGLALLARGRA